MPDSKLGTVSYVDTPAFRQWLKDKGYDWDRMSYWERERTVIEQQREGLEQARKDGQG